jgi:hypothetical protein
MYDLDKTQEWLNRTMQLGKAPPVRGGVSPEPHARRYTMLSMGAAALVIILGMLLISWKRSGVGERIESSSVVDADSKTRVQVIIAPPQSSQASSFANRSSNSIHRPVPNHTPPVAVWSRTALDGNVTPLPGHTAPPAPIWLDGASHRTP